MAFQVIDKTYIGNTICRKNEVCKIIRQSGYKPEYSGKDKTMYIVHNFTLIRARQKQGNYFNDDPVCKMDYYELIGTLINKYSFKFSLVYSVQ